MTDQESPQGRHSFPLVLMLTIFVYTTFPPSPSNVPEYMGTFFFLLGASLVCFGAVSRHGLSHFAGVVCFEFMLFVLRGHFER